MRSFIYILAIGLLALAGCNPTVEVKPIRVEPIYITVDVNLRVQRELDDFFSFEKETSRPATQPSTQPV